MTAEPALKHEPQSESPEDESMPLFEAAAVEVPAGAPEDGAGNAARAETDYPRISAFPGREMDLTAWRLNQCTFIRCEGHVLVRGRRAAPVLLHDLVTAALSPRPPVLAFAANVRIAADDLLDWIDAREETPEDAPDYASLLRQAVAPEMQTGVGAGQIDMFESPVPDPAPEPESAPEPEAVCEPDPDVSAGDADDDNDADTFAAIRAQLRPEPESEAPPAAPVPTALIFDCVFDGKADAVTVGQLPGRDGIPEGATVSLVTGPAQGILVLDPAGEFRFTPEPGYTGVARFSCRVKAPDGRSALAEVRVAIGVPAPDPAAGRAEGFAEIEESPPEPSPEPVSEPAPAPDVALVPEDAPGPEPEPRSEPLAVGGDSPTMIDLDEDLAVAPQAARDIADAPEAAEAEAEPADAGDDEIFDLSADLIHDEGAAAPTLDAAPEPEPKPEPEPRPSYTPVPMPELEAPDLWVVTQEETTIAGNLLADAGIEGVDLSVSIDTPAANGFVLMTADGTCAYTPSPGFAGTDSFVYRLNHPSGATATGTISVRVEALRTPAGLPAEAAPEAAEPRPVPEIVRPAGRQYRETLLPESDDEPALSAAPVAAPVTALGETRGAARAIVPPAPPGRIPGRLRALRARMGRGARGQAGQVALIAGARFGTVVLDPRGAFTYQPNPGYRGTDAFSYRVLGDDCGDGSATEGEIALFVGISAPAAESAGDNDATPPEGCFVTHPDRPVTGRVPIAAAGEGDQAPAEPEPVSHPEDPVAEGPAAEIPGFETETETEATAAAVPAPEEPPLGDLTEASGDVAVAEEASVPAPETPGIQIVAGPDHGFAELDEDGEFTYTPDPGFTGRDRFLCRVVREDGMVETVSVAVDVDRFGEIDVMLDTTPEAQAPEDAPEADATDAPRPDNAPEGSVILTADEPGETADDLAPEAAPVAPIAPRASAGMLIEIPGHHGAAGGNTHLAVSEPPAHGTLEPAPGGFLYVPEPHFIGPDRFSYTLTDETGRRDTAMVNLMIDPAPPGSTHPDDATPWGVAAE